MLTLAWLTERPDTDRVADLRRRVRDAMEQPPAYWECPAAHRRPLHGRAAARAQGAGDRAQARR